MYQVIRANGDTFSPQRRHYGSGRPGKYPFAHLDVGDHFIAPHDAHASLKALISQGRKFGREHDLLRGTEVGTFRVMRTQ